MGEQFADPTVSKGWLLLEAKFPTVVVVLAAAHLRPPAIVVGVRFDYTSYDALPPSVRLINPFTREPYTFQELPTQLLRALPPQTVELPGAPAGLQVQGAQPLMQAHNPEDIPFLCVAGTREYHNHPAHSGDAWELHRMTGAGRLVRLLELIHTYGVGSIRGYGVQLTPTVGFERGEPPP
jgi:hypothetical protein